MLCLCFPLGVFLQGLVVQLLSHVWFLATSWTPAHQASLSFTIFWSCYIFLDWSFDRYILPFFVSYIIFILKSFKILPDMSIVTPVFFWFQFAWNIFFQLLTFSLFVSLGLKWFSYIQYIYQSCSCIHSASLCLLVGVFCPFTFKVIINM